MIAASLTGGNWDLRRQDVALPPGKGARSFVKHERMTL
jgi:hypothetical protein